MFSRRMETAWETAQKFVPERQSRPGVSISIDRLEIVRQKLTSAMQLGFSGVVPRQRL